MYVFDPLCSGIVDDKCLLIDSFEQSWFVNHLYVHDNENIDPNYQHLLIILGDVFDNNVLVFVSMRNNQ